jgi:hypothetical protein
MCSECAGWQQRSLCQPAVGDNPTFYLTAAFRVPTSDFLEKLAFEPRIILHGFSSAKSLLFAEIGLNL